MKLHHFTQNHIKLSLCLNPRGVVGGATSCGTEMRSEDIDVEGTDCNKQSRHILRHPESPHFATAASENHIILVRVRRPVHCFPVQYVSLASSVRRRSAASIVTSLPAPRRAAKDTCHHEPSSKAIRHPGLNLPITAMSPSNCPENTPGWG